MVDPRLVVKKRRGELTVAGVRINSLEEPERNPDIHRKDMEVPGEVAIKQRAANRSRSEDHDLCGVRVLRSKTERRAVLVVDLVDVLVEGAVVQDLVRDVVESVFEDEEEDDLAEDGSPIREGHLVGRHPERFGKRVE